MSDDSQHVHVNRPPGRKCSNPECPYNDNAYDQHRPEANGGLCLNCTDDQDRWAEEDPDDSFVVARMD